MQGIYVAALITTIMALAFYGTPIFLRARGKDALLIGLAIVFQLPMCALALYVVRNPLIGFLNGAFGSDALINTVLSALWAPLTEEPAKLWPLLIPWFRRSINSKNALSIALALGLGFGIGEAWMVAERVGSSPSVSDLPWYIFSGFIWERFQVCFYHGAFTAFAILWLRRRFYVGYLLAMLFHFLLNFPIVLSIYDVGGIGTQGWQLICASWINLGYFVMIGVVLYFRFGSKPNESEKPNFYVWHFLWGIAALVLFFPVGIVAIVLSSIAHLDWNNGEKEASKKKLRIAKYLAGSGVILGTIGVLATMIFLASTLPSAPAPNATEYPEVTGEQRDQLFERLDPAVGNLLEGYNEGNHEKFSRDFSEDMQKALNSFRFATDRMKLIAQYGNCQKRELLRIEEADEHYIVIYKGTFARSKNTHIRVSFKAHEDEFKVDGLFFRDPPR